MCALFLRGPRKPGPRPLLGLWCGAVMMGLLLYSHLKRMITYDTSTGNGLLLIS